jgi:hypothetical protein
MITREQGLLLEAGDPVFLLTRQNRLIELTVDKPDNGDGKIRWVEGRAMLRPGVNEHTFFLKREDAVASRRNDKILAK